ncbi:Uncharacterized conserved protein YkwD, contains CAP (CSP/antigen 5/PR1) domain [Friedmanniella luteola]|uniref:Uncharacterized conserved protein YkwD, contains CAP (CSP/antigen 5/PR1) domain n=1 Tax=Friedmanniella luteola TaxID=546871 RepID=A0A1H1LJC3_9ACTN|nr:CAP domain-containing protein [Friedmanniella luteola]SDR74643.1 Uncharacterized conserved protein YkwD, contains CAP (CSP/antigen 5/PR1) domain [Friedmanniella luteola]
MSRSPGARRLTAALVGLGTAVGLLALAPAPASAATVQRASCVDGGGVRWDVQVTWGAPYTSGTTTKVALDRAGWTTSTSGPLPTDSRVRTYDGDGERLQDLLWSGSFDYQDGAASRARNPVNPPSAPGRAKVVVSLGVDGDGFGSCSVTLKQPAATTASAADRYESDVIAATNPERTSRGLAALTAQSCLDSYAERQARAMAAEERMYHQELRPVLEACDLRTVGENVAYGYPSGAAVTEAWMDSPGHRANILNAQFRLIGVGAAQSSDGVWYSAQVFGTLA